MKKIKSFSLIFGVLSLLFHGCGSSETNNTTIQVVESSSASDCSEEAIQSKSLNEAIKAYPIVGTSDKHTYKTFQTAYGYACTVYFNKTKNASTAQMVLVTLDKNCNILHSTPPSDSTTSLQ